MTTFEIEYTTDLDDRHTMVMLGINKTEVYLKFVAASAMHYIITDIKEVG